MRYTECGPVIDTRCTSAERALTSPISALRTQFARTLKSEAKLYKHASRSSSECKAVYTLINDKRWSRKRGRGRTLVNSLPNLIRTLYRYRLLLDGFRAYLTITRKNSRASKQTLWTCQKYVTFLIQFEDYSFGVIATQRIPRRAQLDGDRLLAEKYACIGILYRNIICGRYTRELTLLAGRCARGLMRTREIERNGAMAREKLQITQRYFERHIGKAQRVNRMSARQRTENGRGGGGEEKKSAASRPRVYFR